MSIQVRPATQADIPWILGQLKEFDKFAAFKRPLLENWDYARQGIADMIKGHLFLVADKEAPGWGPAPLGFIAGYDTPHPFNPGLRVLTEVFWWVAVDARRTRAGASLLEAFLAYGRKHCHWISFGLEHHSPVSPRHLTERGFRHKETTFLLEV